MSIDSRVEGESVAISAAIVVFGATGDLAARKLYPAIASLAARGQLPSRLTLIGNARKELTDDEFAELVYNAVEKAGDGHDAGRLDALRRRNVRFKYLTGSADDSQTYAKLRTLIDDPESCGPSGNVLYYLSTVPTVFDTIATGLGHAGLSREPPGAFRRFVIEKPFGHDVGSAEDLDQTLHEHFDEHQIYRIDHYLAKETVQNILALRFTNTIFEPLWNRRYVDRVEITVAESLGVEHRGAFYEHAGALRDIVQNHLMQVLSLVVMEAPASFGADEIRNEKVKALRSVRPLEPSELSERVVRAQYTAGTIDGVDVPGYRDEESVDPNSHTDTYVAMHLDVDNWRWAGVPFYLRTGKRLARRVTEIALSFKPVPFLPLPRTAVDSLEPNTMILHIQPNEGITVSFAAKVPGQEFRVRGVNLDFTYGSAFAELAPEAYERVLFDALLGDPTLFIRSDEVDQAWRIVQPLVDCFADPSFPLAQYPAGSWGPPEADTLLERGDHWRVML